MDSGAGSNAMTMLSQNAVRKRKNMTLPLVLHGVFPAVDVKLAEPFESEVRSVPSILRMFESSCPRLFLKFERFSSLRKRRQLGGRERECDSRAGLGVRRTRIAGTVIVLPPFGNASFTI